MFTRFNLPNGFRNLRFLFITFTSLLTACGSLAKDIGLLSSDGAWEVYPDTRDTVVYPASEKLTTDGVTNDNANGRVAFKITPALSSSESTARIDFGDRSAPAELNLDCSEENKKVKCEPIFIEHIYRRKGVYKPSIHYSGNGASTFSNGIIIAEKAISEQALKGKAIENMLDDLVRGLRTTVNNPGGTKFAVGVLRDANFEYAKDEKDFQIVKKINQGLVNRGFSVLEKHPQALVRLAHDSVVEWDEEKNKARDHYLDNMEHSLQTRHAGEQKPFLYSTKIEGVDDSKELIEVGQKLTSYQERESRESDDDKKGKRNKIDRSDIESDILQEILKRRRPLLLAKFNTADNLILIDRVVDPVIRKSDPGYFNIEFKKAMVKRTASVKVHARLLSREGHIRWISDIEGKASDLVIPAFVEPDDELVAPENKVSRPSNATGPKGTVSQAIASAKKGIKQLLE